jgi:hypothetical protein
MSNIGKRQTAKKAAGSGFFSPSGPQFRLCRGAAIDPRSLAVCVGDRISPDQKPAMSGPGLLQG